jgi:hypothetical protein
LDVEHLAILCAGAAGLAGLPCPFAALTGGAVYLLIELAARDAATLQRLSKWQIGPWRTIVGAALVGAGHCSLGWGVGMGMRVVLG